MPTPEAAGGAARPSAHAPAGRPDPAGVRVCVVGAGSFIGRALRAEPACAHWQWVDHRAALDWAADAPGVAAPDGGALASGGAAGGASGSASGSASGGAAASAHPLDVADVVLNCAFDPRARAGDDPAAVDIDAVLARALARRGPGAGGVPPSAHLPHYVMLSTRMVWGQAGAEEGTRVLTAARAAAPAGPYARAKWRAEQAVVAALPGRCTVLRLANIFGAEAAPGLTGRRTFLAQALRSLREDGAIRLDISPFVARDFLPVETLAAWLAVIVPARRAGLWGLGSGQATPVGRIAQWLIEGLGAGRLEVSDLREHDGFVIDMAAARTDFGLPPLDGTQVAACCRALGAGLRTGD